MHQHHHAHKLHCAVMCARKTRPRTRFLFYGELCSKIISFEVNSYQMIGLGAANDTSNVAGTVGIISDAIE